MDIERFGSRSDGLQQVLRDRLYRVMETALETVGVNRQDVRDPEDRGDGLLWVLPSWVSMVALTGRFTARLHTELLEYPAGGDDAMRLRAALHVGMVKADRNTWVGTALNTAFRLLNAEPLREALAGTSAPYALLMSREWRDRIGDQDIEGFDWRACREAVVDVKELHASAWVYVPRDLPRIPPSRPLGGRLRRLAEREAEVERAERRARERRADIGELFTGVPEFRERPDDVRSVLELVRERGQASEQRWAVPDVVRCEEIIESHLERVEEFTTGLEGLRAERDELRGRLGAYKAKEASGVSPEDPRLAALYGEAHEMLWKAPCDLRAARAAVERYQAALWHALGYKGTRS
ncbi:hypothetical protein [Actinomadura chibensis]|uniref:Uncharacterized protein n=1 Tax=Actinomadura chibensis TaxID=392828 RepID=A0A5D0NMJ8_9ACTN|nr:hypothetical protein [Actinomadura chibensis]TYB45498.1 hypothetical protein FXF69_18880 [Actinomadura chibensis]